MNDLDDNLDGDLLRQLAAADVPPPAGVAITPARLGHRARRHLQRQLVTAAAVVTLLGTPLLLWPRPDTAELAPPATASLEISTELSSLQARLERWQQRLATMQLPAIAPIASGPTPLEQQRWRHDLAQARASALLPAPTSTRSETRR